MEKATLDELVLAILIKKTSVINKEFDTEVLQFFRTLYRRCRPDKFLVQGLEADIIAGKVVMHDYPPKHRVLCFTFSNGYVWMASLIKIASRGNWQQANIIADRTIAHASIERIDAAVDSCRAA